MASNRLSQETSPYLLQHADNPVDWHAWGPEALAMAKSEEKPILLSVGYAACHWCHVMAHECFEDPDIAAVMNELYVNIKVDREERPDLDTIYQSALALLGQQGGWPLTMFLTPEGEPFWGGTYFPPTPRFGRPGFPDVLRGIAGTYHREPDKVTKNVDALREALGKLAANQRGDAIPPEAYDSIAERLASEVDPVHGGLGGAPKFPQPSIFTLLWRAYRRTGRDAFRLPVTTTLTAMCQGGIYDHLGGGFARYSVDGEWLAPHFEKMLYDNAQLISLLTLVWQHTGEPLYEIRIRETVDWLLREMISEGGGFAATLDADSEGEEGKFYVWSAGEIDRLLGDKAALFARAYDVTPGGNWEGKTILNRRRGADITADDVATLAECRAILLKEREKRVRPGWDDKVLADWNGLAITALADAGSVFGETAWVAAAETAFAFVRDRMTVDGRLHHSARNGKLRNLAMLDDYANMAAAGLALLEATGDAGYLEQSKRWLEELDLRFWDSGNGGYFFTADDADDLIVRTKSIHDNAVPAGNGTMLAVLARLFYLTGEEAYLRKAEAVSAAFAGEIGRNFFPMSTFVNAAEFLSNALQIVISGTRGDAATDALARQVLDLSLPNRILTIVDPETKLPSGHPAAGKGQIDGKPTAYVCAGLTCGPPVTDPDALRGALEEACKA